MSSVRQNNVTKHTLDLPDSYTHHRKEAVHRQEDARHPHRSQRDPLSRNEPAPQRVLKEVVPVNLVGKVRPLQDDHLLLE